MVGDVIPAGTVQCPGGRMTLEWHGMVLGGTGEGGGGVGLDGRGVG